MRTDSDKPKVQKTYPQKWAAYNAAQTTEKAHFLELLHALCAEIRDPIKQTNGRPKLLLNDVIFAVCYKTYSGFSGRRFMTDLRSAEDNGYISRAPHFNSLFNYLENPDLSPILEDLIIKTSLPLASVETEFAVDSSGFTASQLHYWKLYKYAEKKEHDWVKVHIVCGVKTNIVTAIKIAGRMASDSRMMPDLIATTAENFTMKEVSADKGYVSGYNFKVVDEYGALPFIAFKSNSKGGGNNDVWKKMFHYFKLHEEEYMSHYHKRSNVETTFSMIKAKFGGYVRSKTPTAMKNECLCKIICHNICCLIQESHELGIDIDFRAN